MPTLNPRGNDAFRLLARVEAGRLAVLARCIERPADAQDEALARVLQAARGTDFGRQHGLGRVRTLADYRQAVPIRSPEEHLPDLQAVVDGHARRLVAHPVSSFVKTSGTTGAPKLLAVTGPWARAVSDAQRLWVLAMVAEQEEVSTGLALTTVGSAVEGTTPSGLPFGSNTGRMQQAQSWWIRRRLAVPHELFALGPPELRHYCLLRLALSADVRTWTTANPSTVLMLARALERWREPLARDLADGTLKHGPAAGLPRRWRLRWWPRLGLRTLGDGKLGQLWDLACINCWKGGAAPFFIERFPQALGRRVRVREVGITASEGYFALPLHSSWAGGLAWAAGHLLEFVDATGTAHGVQDVAIGAEYNLVISTTSGLYRYDMNDRVKVVGRLGRAPLLTFVGKGSDMLSVTGEKVSAWQVGEAMRRAGTADVRGFAVSVELGELPRYEVLHEAGTVHAEGFDRALQELNAEYAGKREGRLAPPSVRSVPDGTFGRFRASRLRSGAADGQVKDPVLVADAAIVERLRQGWR